MSVKMSKIACQQCGADLEVNEEVRFLTCRYCNSRLEIVHDPSVSYSRILDQLVQKQTSIENELKLIRLHRKLHELEQGWESYRQSVSSRAKDGQLVDPSMRISALPMLASIPVGIVLMILVGESLNWIAGGLCFPIPVFLGFFISGSLQRKKNEFLGMRHRFLQQRTSLKGVIHGLEKNGAMRPMKRSGG